METNRVSKDKILDIVLIVINTVVLMAVGYSRDFDAMFFTSLVLITLSFYLAYKSYKGLIIPEKSLIFIMMAGNLSLLLNT